MSGAARKPRSVSSDYSGERARPRLLTLQDVADILRCCVKTVQRRVDDGELRVIRDGRLLRVHPDDLDRYIAERRGRL